MDLNNKGIALHRDYFVRMVGLNKDLPPSMKSYNSETKLELGVDGLSSNNVAGTLNTKASLNGWPPPSLNEYFTMNYSLCEAQKIQLREICSWIQHRAALRQLNSTSNQVLIEALSVAYICLREKKPSYLLEESIERIIGIAAILVEMKADMNVVIAGILQEVIAEFKELQNTPAAEHEGLFQQQLIKQFGEDSIHLAIKYSRLPQFTPHHTSYSAVQAENQLQMLVAVAEDYRTLYIRLAERLHTMRGLRKHQNYTLFTQQQVAMQVRHVYAPLAHRMGSIKVRSELEDLAFRILEPDMFVLARYTQTAAAKAYQDAVDKIEDFVRHDPMLVANRVHLRLTYRIKSKYQIHLKMQYKKFKTPLQVRDTLGLRLIIDIPSLVTEMNIQYLHRKHTMCYYIIHSVQNMPGWEAEKCGFKDFIKYQKDNGYQSLHQYIRHLSLNVCVEVQVCTCEMHIIAEVGGAAHWWYKDMIYRPEVARSKAYRLAWRSKYQLSASSAAELIGLAKQQLLAHRVFVLREDGATVLNLKKGATALDAAFAIHSSMGLHAQVIRVNNHTVSMDTVLHMGDVVSVDQLQSNTETTAPLPVTVRDTFVSPHKLAQVRTRYAFKVLRKFFRQHNRDTSICIGLIKLLYALELNAEMLDISIRDAQHLVELVHSRMNVSIVEVLQDLGTTTDDAYTTRTLSKLFQKPHTQLKSVAYDRALQWAHRADKETQHNNYITTTSTNTSTYFTLSLPLLCEVLSAVLLHAHNRDVAADNLVKCWKGLISSEDSWSTLLGKG